VNDKNVHNIFENKDENAFELIKKFHGFMSHFENFGVENG
jgi:hypothetical protein